MAGRMGYLAGWLLGCLSIAAAQYNITTFHGDSQRTGWIAKETILNPYDVSSGNFGPIWDSPQFDSVTVEGKLCLPHLYASPLYVDRVKLTAGDFAGETLHVVFAASKQRLRLRRECGAQGYLDPSQWCRSRDDLVESATRHARRQPGRRSSSGHHGDAGNRPGSNAASSVCGGGRRVKGLAGVPSTTPPC